LQDPEYAVKDTPVIHMSHAAQLVREQLLDDVPSAFGAFLAHDSRHVNHVFGHATDRRSSVRNGRMTGKPGRLVARPGKPIEN
jgi:hypothetical protein